MVTNTASVGILVYWPFCLVCICGIVLAVIMLMALLLIKGQDEFPRVRKWLRLNVNDSKEEDHTATLQKRDLEIRFFRIGRDGQEQLARISSNRWVSVGSGKNADICLDAADRKLAQRHFKLFLGDTALKVAPVEKETFVNGVPIRKLEQAYLRSGDLIRAGSHEYRVMFALHEERENAT